VILHLHGALAEHYGPRHEVFVPTVKQAIGLLAGQLDGFRRRFQDARWLIMVGNPETGLSLGEQDLGFQTAGDVHLVPAIDGAGGGRGKAVIGFAILATAIVMSGGTAAGSAGLLSGMSGEAFTVMGASVSWGTVASYGALIGLSGVAMMMAPTPNSDYESREENPSFIFNGVQNTTNQGLPVPIVYGRHLVGSQVISASLVVENLSA
jgi:predicted phage tail protein